MRARLAIALALLMLLAALPAWAQDDPLAGNYAPLPGPEWRLYQSRGVSLSIPQRWYGFFYVGYRPFYGWWARKLSPLYTEMEFSLCEMPGQPWLGQKGQVRTKALGPARLAGRDAQAFEQVELAGTQYARRRLILVLQQPLPDGQRLWAVADSDANKWEQTRAWREAILASLRIEPYFFVLGSQWRLVEKGGVYLQLPWGWQAQEVPDGWQWSGPAGQDRSLAVGWRKGKAPDLAGWHLAGQSRVGKYACAVYERLLRRGNSATVQRLALLNKPLKDGRRLWLRGDLRGARGMRDWQELGPALDAMLRGARIDWVLF